MNLIKMIKIVLIFLISSLVGSIFLFSILSFAFLIFEISFDLLSKLVLVCACSSIFISSFIVLQLSKSYRLTLGLICGFVFAIIITTTTIIAFPNKHFLNLAFFIKIGSVILSSFLGATLTKLFK